MSDPQQPANPTPPIPSPPDPQITATPAPSDPVSTPALPATKTKARWKLFNRDQTVGIVIGLIVAVITTAWAIEDGRKEPELTYSVQASPTELNKPTFDSDFAFTYKGYEIASNTVSVAEIAVWNRGRKSIKSGDILQPIVLTVPNHILSVKVKRVTRGLCGFKADVVDHGGPRVMESTNEVDLTWTILEHNDGALLQVIYDGDSKQQFTVTGAIEGQEGIKQTIDKPEVRIGLYQFAVNVLTLVTMWVLLCLVIAQVKYGRKPKQLTRKDMWIALAITVVGTMFYGATICEALLNNTTSPFGW